MKIEKRIDKYRKFEKSNNLQTRRLGSRLLGQIMVTMWEGNRLHMKENFYQAALESAEILLLFDNTVAAYSMIKAEALIALDRKAEARLVIDSLRERNIEYHNNWENNKYLKKIL